MALVSMRQLLDHAAERGYGVPAFNVNNLNKCGPSWRAPPRQIARSSFKPLPAPVSTLERIS